MHVEHQTEDQTFYLTSHGYEGELAYARPSADVVDFQHTYVDEHLRGQGAGDALAQAALTWARQEKLHVKASCPFVAKYIERHAEYQDLLAK